MTLKAETRTVYRDSKDGRFIPRAEAERRPSTTEKQRVRTNTATRKPSTERSKKGGLK